MYVRMATWPIASRDVAGTPVPRLFPVAYPWLSPELERWATSHTHHVISQPRPSPFLRRYSLPRKSKRARNGEGLGPRLSLGLSIKWSNAARHCQNPTHTMSSLPLYLRFKYAHAQTVDTGRSLPPPAQNAWVRGYMT